MSADRNVPVATSRDALVQELHGIRSEIAEYNDHVRKNRIRVWLLGGVITAVIVLGGLFYVDDKRDDQHECESDNANSVRDSEVLIRAMDAASEEDLSSAIQVYRAEVQRNLRDC